MRASLITIFNALLFSFPPLDTDRKSFVRNVPIPNEAVKKCIRYIDAVQRARPAARRTNETKLVALLLKSQRLLVRQGIGVDDGPLTVIRADRL